MRSKKLLRISLIILLLSMIALGVSESAYAGTIILQPLKLEYGHWILKGTATTHPNAPIKVTRVPWRNGQMHYEERSDITNWVNHRQTDANGNIDAWMEGDVINAGDTIIVEIEDQWTTTYAMVAPVGGLSFSVYPDKSDLLSLYIGMTSAILAIAVAAPVYIKRRIRRDDQ
jgi:hypothetical protein